MTLIVYQLNTQTALLHRILESQTNVIHIWRK